MLPSEGVPSSPGEVLLEEFLRPLGVTAVDLATRLRTSPEDVELILVGARPITPAMAAMLSAALGTSAEFWTNLQDNWERASAAR
jgi:addiction module HigA family antidote